MSQTAAARRSLAWLWFLVGSAVLTQTALNLVRPVTSYKLLALGGGEAEIGLATAVYALLPLATAVWLGRSTDRWPRLSPVVAAGAGLLGLGGVLLAAAPDTLTVLAGSAVLGMGHLAFTIAGQASIARFAGPGRLDAGFGWFTAAYSVGQMIGPLLTGVFLGTVPLAQAAADGPGLQADIEAALWWGAGISLLAVPLMLLPAASGRRAARHDDGAPAPSAPATRTAPASAGDNDSAAAETAAAETGVADAGRTDAGRADVRSILRLPGLPSLMLASLALLAVLDVLTAFLPLVGEELGVSPAVVGGLLALRGAGSVVSRVVLPWLTARIRRQVLVLVSLAGSAATVALVPGAMAQPGAMPAAWVLMAVAGLTLGLGQPLTMSLVTEAVPDSWRSTALAVRLTANRLGQVVLPAAAGLVAAPLGASAAIWFSCVVLGGSAVERGLRRLGGRD